VLLLLLLRHDHIIVFRRGVLARLVYKRFVHKHLIRDGADRRGGVVLRFDVEGEAVERVRVVDWRQVEKRFLE